MEGKSGTAVQTLDVAAQQQQAFDQILNAARSIPREERVEFDEARRKCLGLVQRESDPRRFLMHEDFDVNKAARRIVNYWRVRKEVFGERAFLPITLCGNGAPGPDLIYAIREHIVGALPNDSDGRAITFVDHIRSFAFFQQFPHLQRGHLFFWLQQVALNPKSQTEGHILLLYCSGNQLIQINKNTMNSVAELMESVVPVKLKTIHILCVPTKEEREDFFSTTFPCVMENLGEFFSKRVVVHVCQDEYEIPKELQSFGISRQGLPSIVGGEWTYEVDHLRFLVSWGYKPQNADMMPPQQLFGPSPFNFLGLTATRWLGGHQAVFPVAQQRIAAARNEEIYANLDEVSFSGNEAVEQRGLTELEGALQFIPEEEKTGYLEAVRRVPFLVKTESNPVRFLRFERFNTWAAARRLVTYWKWRVRIFGDRAFLPLNQTGRGALNREDIELLNSGYFAFLPNDSRGRTVICYDPSRRIDCAPEARVRVGFYLWSVMSENEVSQKDGYVAIVLLSRANFGKPKLDGTVKKCVDLLVASFPTRPFAFHVAYSPPKSKHRSFLESLLPLSMRLMAKMMEPRGIVHVGDSEDELANKLENHGLTKSGLPESLGGNWSYDNYFVWLDQRRLLEAEFYEKKLPLAAVRPEKQGSGATQPPSSETEIAQLQKCGVEKLLQAVDIIPDHEKTAYLEAMKVCPHLVEKESDPVSFLRFERYSVWNAARRLVRYWQVRKDVFGRRAFLPLDQTGDGALDRKDINVLGTGYLSQIPTDSSGRSVLYCDGTRLSKSTRESRLRCTFYMYSIACENERSQSDGYVVLYVRTEPSFDRANKECLEMVEPALPGSLSAFHVISIPSESDEDADAADQVETTLDILGDSVKKKATTHFGKSRSSLAETLLGYGFTIDGLPKSLGGNWGFGNFVQWQELRVRYEWGLPAGAGVKDEDSFFDFSKVKPFAELSEEDKIERKRRMNVIHSRRKRERERIEVEGLNEQCLELRDHRDRLRNESQRLEILLAEANRILKDFFSGRRINDLKPTDADQLMGTYERLTVNFKRSADDGNALNDEERGKRLKTGDNNSSSSKHQAVGITPGSTTTELPSGHLTAMQTYLSYRAASAKQENS